MTKAITKNSKKGFTLVELVIVIAILAILAAIAIPVVNSIINTASKNSALSNAETIELAVKNCQADIAARNNEVYNGTTTYKPQATAQNQNPTPVACKKASTDYAQISIAEVAGMNAIYDALESVTYNNATYEPYWDKTRDGVIFVNDAASGDDTVLTSEGVEKITISATDHVQLAAGDVVKTNVMIVNLSSRSAAANNNQNQNP